jgi:hypothetical protein
MYKVLWWYQDQSPAGSLLVDTWYDAEELVQSLEENGFPATWTMEV